MKEKTRIGPECENTAGLDHLQEKHVHANERNIDNNTKRKQYRG